jgi:selenide,water dikinase
LRPLSDTFQAADYPALLVGLSEPDDAAVYQLNETQAIISTTDFFPPVVDAPYAFGAIAAANALSDVYAMGGDPLFAINLAAFPENLELSILSDILRGGADTVKQSGAVIAGGHTITDKEPKYGLAVTGIVHPQRILTKGGAQPGDTLILTKPLGTGVITTALKQEKVDPAHLASAVQSMIGLNRIAANAAQQLNQDGIKRVHAATDITGFGLIGHAHEMAHLSNTDFILSFKRLPFLPGALNYAQKGTFPGGMARNLEYFGQWVTFSSTLSEELRMLCYDPQTSGGLLIAVESGYARQLIHTIRRKGATAHAIGTVTTGSGRLSIR